MATEKRLIDANALIQKHGSDVTNWDKPYAVKISSIENAPTVDAVEVVRCKDCIHYKPERVCRWDEEKGEWDRETIVVKPFGECTGQKLVFTEDAELTVGENDFCSYGERKDNG